MIAVVVMCGPGLFVYRFLQMAADRGMTDGDYLFISLRNVNSDIEDPWSIREASPGESTLAAFRNLIQVTTAALLCARIRGH